MSLRSTNAVLRCYPAPWRERYGDELLAMVEDVAGGRPVPIAMRASLAGHGLGERVRAFGLFGAARTQAERKRAGSLAVLWAWALIVLAGCSFAKYAEHWPGVVSHAHHGLASLGFTTVLVAAIAGCGLVFAGAAVAMPALRSAGAGRVLRPAVLVAGGCLAAAIVATVGLVVLAHRTGPGGHAGSWPYRLVLVLWVAAISAAVLACAALATRAGRRLELSDRQIDVEAWLAYGLATAAAAVAVGMALWWAAVAPVAGHLPDAGGSGWDPQLVATGSTLAAALVLAGLGTASMTAARHVAGPDGRLPSPG